MFEKEGKRCFRRERSARGGPGAKSRRGGREGNACQETIVFAIPPTNYVSKNNTTVNDQLSDKSGRETLIFSFCFPKKKKTEVKGSEVTYYKKKVQMRSSVERRKLQRCVTCYIKSSINLLRRLLKETCSTSQLALQCLSEKYLKHFASSRIGSSRAYKRTLLAGKEELNFEDLQESCNQLLK